MRIGVDVGGTKIEAAALHADGSFAMRRRIATPSDGYDAMLNAIVTLIDGMEAALGQRCSLGFGVPGALSPATGVIKNAPNAPIDGHPFDRDLETLLDRPIRMMNDANCFALSEASDGAARGAAIVFGVILGTGCGGGVVIDGAVLRGRNAVAGEWGHNPLPWMLTSEYPGPHCKCGMRGCIETYLSGTGFAARHAADTGTRLDAAAIVAAAENGDPACNASMARYESRLARALAHVINLLDPDVIVLGGGMSNVARLYANVPGMWREWVFSDRVDTVLVPPAYGDSSGVRGAAWLWPEDAAP
ncbi:MAG: ROK family protein [Alphaproteobacteria bacterium]